MHSTRAFSTNTYTIGADYETAYNIAADAGVEMYSCCEKKKINAACRCIADGASNMCERARKDRIQV